MNKIIPEYVQKEFMKNPQIGRKDLAKATGITESEARFYCKLYKDSRKNVKCKSKGVALFDIHYPSHDKAVMRVVMAFLKDFKPDHLVLGGDQLQMDSISYFNTKKPKLVEGKRLNQDYKGFQKDILDKIDEAVPSKCKRYFIMGNHEYRIERLIEGSPQYEGFIEVEKNLDLSTYKIIPFNETMHIGSMHFTHGWYWNKYYTEKTLRTAQKTMFVGHAHFPQVHTFASPIDALPKQCIGVGCLCNANPDYGENKPNAWVHQFLFWYMLEDGSFTYYTPIIINGKCVINGKLYDGNIQEEDTWEKTVNAVEQI